jgi:hypothetical protein
MDRGLAGDKKPLLNKTVDIGTVVLVARIDLAWPNTCLSSRRRNAVFLVYTPAVYFGWQTSTKQSCVRKCYKQRGSRHVEIQTSHDTPPRRESN